MAVDNAYRNFKLRRDENEWNPVEDIIRRSELVVRGIAQESPPYINTCQKNSFLSAVRFSFFYNSGNFAANFKFLGGRGKKIEDVMRVIQSLSREVEVDPILVKTAYNQIAKVNFSWLSKNQPR